jgi:hypothetical protein
MFVFKKALPRRTFLRGVGTTMALPLLEAMVPGLYGAGGNTPARPPLRFGAVYIPNGASMAALDAGRPRARAHLPILKPLEPHRERAERLQNLSRAGGRSVTDHAVSSAGWLSGAVAKQTEAEDVSVGVTIDQVLARHVGQDTQFPSMELATEDFTGYIGGCVPGYACTYMNTISWASETRRCRWRSIRAPRSSGCSAGRRAGGAAGADARGPEHPRLGARGGAKSCSAGWACRTGRGWTEYLDHVREIERRIERAEAQHAMRPTAAVAPLGVPESFEEHAMLMFDLHRRRVPGRHHARVHVHDVAGGEPADVPEPRHPAAVPRRLAPCQPSREHGDARQDQHVLASLFARFVERLGTIAEGDGTLLDHSLVFYGCGMSDGQAHSPYPMMLASVGTAGGRVKGNRIVTPPEWTPIANLWLGVANMYGSPIESFGESTGRVEL